MKPNIGEFNNVLTVLILDICCINDQAICDVIGKSMVILANEDFSQGRSALDD
jgi:hypothetical protein